MNAAWGGGSLTRCAECCSMPRCDVRPGLPTARSLSYRIGRRERVRLQQSVFREGPKVTSSGRHVLEGAENALRYRRDTKRDVTMHVTCEGQKVKVRLRLDHQVAFGEHLALLGSTEAAGSWTNRVVMGWTEAGWVVDVEADPGETIEYKYLIVTWDGFMVWEHGANRVLVVPEDFSKYYQVVSHWSDTSEAIDLEVIDGSQAPEGGASEAIDFEVIDGSQAPEGGATEPEPEAELTNEKGDSEVIGGTQSPADGATKALIVEAIDSERTESIEGTHEPEGVVTEAQQVEREGNANGSLNLGKSEPYDSQSSVIRGEEFSSLGSIEDSRRRVGRGDTTGIGGNSSKSIVEGDQNPATWQGKISILFLLLIICGVVSLGFVSLLKS